MAAAKRSVLSSLAVYAEDSDPESDSEAGTAGSDGGAAAGEGREGSGEGGAAGAARPARAYPGGCRGEACPRRAAFPAAWDGAGGCRGPFLTALLFPSGEKGGLVSVGYGEDDFTRLDGDEDGYEEEDDENSRQSVSAALRPELARSPLARWGGLPPSEESPERQPRLGPGTSAPRCGC